MRPCHPKRNILTLLRLVYCKTVNILSNKFIPHEFVVSHKAHWLVYEVNWYHEIRLFFNRKRWNLYSIRFDYLQLVYFRKAFYVEICNWHTRLCTFMRSDQNTNTIFSHRDPHDRLQQYLHWPLGEDVNLFYMNYCGICNNSTLWEKRVSRCILITRGRLPHK